MLPAALLSTMLILSPQGRDWSLVYERSNFVETGDYDEALEYCRRLDAHSDQAKLITFGTSPQGRPMVALIIDKDGNFSPDRLAASRRPLVFIENGIHSGEIEGKDASLILARDILVTRTRASLMDGVNLLIVPVFGVDAHERRSAYNRINQNGPREMGWRANAQNLNLNRDWVKARSGEMKAMIGLIHDYRPDFFIDNHTTDGADFQYEVLLGIPQSQALFPTVAQWSKGFDERIRPLLAEDGFPNAPYFELAAYGDPSRGISVNDFSPRYSTGYWGALNRPSLLVETHMLKPYRSRVQSTYATMVRTIEHVTRTADRLMAANADADRFESMAGPGARVVLSVRLDGQRRPFQFLGYEFAPYNSPLTGAQIPNWNREQPLTIDTTVMDSYAPAVTVETPAAYVVPAQWTEVIDLLQLHGIQFVRLRRPFYGIFETYRFDEVTWPAAPFEGVFEPRFRLTPIQEDRLLPANSALIPVNQRGLRLILHMLEPAAPDSLVKWGFFNAVMERKEYFESYAMEPIARGLLDADPRLKAEFDEKMRDPKFAGNPGGILEWIFDRSPYADRAWRKYPVVRLTADQAARARL